MAGEYETKDDIGAQLGRAARRRQRFSALVKTYTKSHVAIIVLTKLRGMAEPITNSGTTIIWKGSW